MISFRSALSLTMYGAIPVYVAPADAVLGATLFHNFVHEEFEQEGVSDDELLNAETLLNEEEGQGDANEFIDENFAYAHRAVFQQAHAPQGAKVQQVGSTIRELANEFALSRQRSQIREEADGVDLNHVNRDNFYKLLDEVFKDGVTTHHLIALFYFCSDVLIRCIRLQLSHLGMKCFKWALDYIVRRVCSWVNQHGGWDRVIGRFWPPVPSGYMVATAAAIIIAIGWYSYRGITPK